MDNILEFTGEYYTRQKRSQEFADQLALQFVEYAQNHLDIDVHNQQFMYDMAWVMKFTEVLVDNQLGVANRLSKFMENLKASESGSKK
jgi:predicted metalloenzyme YecM